MKNIVLSIGLSLLFFSNAIADEGMWLPHLIGSMNFEEMQEKGLKLSSEDLYNINSSSLKDAIVSINGGGCTGEMISAEGLMLTNHHCAYDEIQYHSTVENDYLKNGFWAMSKGEELPNKNLTASFLVKIEDVTSKILSELSSDMTELERRTKVNELSREIIINATDSSHYEARVKSFYGGSEYYLFVYEVFKDVRLVGAPPSSIGKFGGDTDNWMWPRHTGDFALYRIYCSPSGKPAEYSIENIPYKPKHHLPIQLDGVENGDYTMIFGYPGSTDRYLTSFGIKQALDISNPTIVDIRSEKLAIMKAGMDDNPKTKIQYASKYARTSNYWKYYIGQSKGLRAMNVYQKKQEIEDKFTKWVESDTAVFNKYSQTLDLIEDAYRTNKSIQTNRLYLNEAIFNGAEIMYWSFAMSRAISSLPEGDEKKTALREIKKEAIEFYKNYDTDIDKELFASMLEMYYYNVPKKQHAPVFKKIENQLFGFKKLDFDWYAKNVFKRSFFSNKEKFFKFLENPSFKKIERDPAYKTMMSIYNEYLKQISPTRSIVREELSEGRRLFISGLREMDTTKNYYPNANSTMRVTYGNIGDYIPAEAMHFDYYTTLDGVMLKEDPSNEEFIIPKKLKDLYDLGDYGEYADENGLLRVNFISNNDITGGNSGSPVINAWGEIVGTAFDGNWEAMSGDIAFEEGIQRTISVDIRYTLFIIDKFAGAKHLIDEMTIAPRRAKVLAVDENNLVPESPNTIIKELKLKDYLGVPLPVFDMHSFGSAFDMAVEKYGSSKEKRFWWRGNVYTTEKK